MVLNINMGFTNLEKENANDEQERVYALYIGDTIYISGDSGSTELTGPSKKKMNSVCIFFGEDDCTELEQVLN